MGTLHGCSNFTEDDRVKWLTDHPRETRSQKNETERQRERGVCPPNSLKWLGGLRKAPTTTLALSDERGNKVSNTASESQRAAKREGVGLCLVKGGYVACRLPKRAKAGSFFFLPQLSYYSIDVRRITTRTPLLGYLVSKVSLV